MALVHQTLAAALAAAGVDTAFGVMGSGTDQLTRDLVDDHAVRYLAARHEHGAVGMADGYARATGRIGVALISADAGLTNAATALATARLAHSRVLVVVGDQAAASKSVQTRFDQVPLQAALGMRTIPVSAGTAARDLQQALRELDLRQGPVLLNLPWDVAAAVDPGSGPRHALRPVPLRSDSVPGEAALDAVLGLIATSRRPLVLAGRGAIGRAEPLLAQLAERIGALSASTLLARGLFAGDPFHLGVCGSFATEQAAELLGETDLVLVFGCSLNTHTRGHDALFARASVIQVDSDPTVLGQRGPVDIGLVGDAAAVAEKLLDACAALDDLDLGALGRPAQGWRTAAVKERIAHLDRWAGHPPVPETGTTADPYQVMRACEEILPRQRLVAIDIGYFLSFPAVFLNSGAAPSMICPWEYGAIGCALGPAIGAALGRPDLYPVLVVGDGGLAASLQELDTVVRAGIAMLVVVLDDGGFRAERELFRAQGQPTETADSVSPDFAAVAAAMGFDAHTVRSGAQMREVLGGLRTERATLVRVLMDSDQPNPEMAAAMRGL